MTTADTHFAAGQLAESKVLTAPAEGRGSGKRQIAEYRAAALQQYERALRLDPEHVPSLYRSGVLLSEMKRHDAAVEKWRQYVEVVGRTPDSLVNLGLACELAGRTPEAQEAYEQACRLDPRHKPAHVNLGLLLAKQGYLQRAQSSLARVLSPASTHWHLGVALQAAGKVEEAEQQFRAAAGLDPAYAERPQRRTGASARVE